MRYNKINIVTEVTIMNYSDINIFVKKRYPEYKVLDISKSRNSFIVKLLCSQHGEFEKSLGALRKGTKCPLCNKKNKNIKFSRSRKSF